MKIWRGYGSEHSADLVMIGQFKNAADASSAKEIIDELTTQVMADERAGLIQYGEPQTKYSDGMLALMDRIRVSSIPPNQLEQFLLDVRPEVKGDKIVIRTDESEIAAFLTVMIDKGARVEIFSAHCFPKEAAECDAK